MTSPEILPERIVGENGLVLRRWLVDDAPALGQAIAESTEHLRPWMAWIADEPQTVEQRRTRIADWEREWSEGGDAVLGIFVADQVAGGCGLHRRRGPGSSSSATGSMRRSPGRAWGRRSRGSSRTRRSASPASTLSRSITTRPNAASAAIPRRLWFSFLGETPDEPAAPAEAGIDCIWRLERRR